MKVCVRNMIYWAIFVSRWLRLSPGVSVLGLLSLFPLFPSILIRQGSVPAGEIHEVSLSYLSFFHIIVLDSLKFMYLSYHIKINKKFFFLSRPNIHSLINVPLAMAATSTGLQLTVVMTVTACIDWFGLRVWPIHKGAICTRIALLWRDTNWDSKNLCSFTKWISKWVYSTATNNRCCVRWDASGNGSDHVPCWSHSGFCQHKKMNMPWSREHSRHMQGKWWLRSLSSWNGEGGV